ncbi:MAG: PilZ domain-containing protein [Gammaproteobacteria bacterium]|nr:PilZ domain-containing protein [Gammaproteobacteria bacterium]MDH5729324.1 PilZ domain-containing protein [Gammaproteobacteria bacterium]
MSQAQQKAHERRRFSRIPFEAVVSIKGPNGKWTGKLIDISLKGMLVSRPQNWVSNQKELLKVEIHPPEEVFAIRMDVETTHSENDHVGFECKHIDIDSVSHLRRLIELNVGDDKILNRELAELSH